MRKCGIHKYFHNVPRITGAYHIVREMQSVRDLTKQVKVDYDAMKVCDALLFASFVWRLDWSFDLHCDTRFHT